MTASHCSAFVAVFFDASSYYARTDLICERMSLSRSLSRLLSSSSSNDGSQQTLNLIRHLLSGLWGKSKISVKVSLLQREIARRNIKYLIKWRNYESESNMWRNLSELSDVMNLIREYKEIINRVISRRYISNFTSSRKINK